MPEGRIVNTEVEATRRSSCCVLAWGVKACADCASQCCAENLINEREKCFEATVACSGACKVAGGQSAWMLGAASGVVYPG